MRPKSLRQLVAHGALGLILAGIAAAPARAQPSAPLSVPPPGPAALEQIPMLREVGIDQKLDAPLPLDAAFVDEHGADVKLGEYFGQRPVVLVLAYYRCPMLCTEVQQGLTGSLLALSFDAGKDFNVVVVSFDPGDTPAMAETKRQSFLRRYGRPGAERGVHFLTGRQASIDRLTKAIGFRYVYDPKIDQFAHPAAITVVTATGHVSRYLFGIEFAPRDLKLGLVEAADNRIGSVIDQVLLYCYHYDPESGRYGLAIINVLRAAGALTVCALGAFIFLSVRRERRQHSAVTPTATGIR